MPGEGTEKYGSETAKAYDPDVPVVPGVAGPVAPSHISGIPTEAKTDTITMVEKPVIQPEPAMEKPNVPQNGWCTTKNDLTFNSASVGFA